MERKKRGSRSTANRKRKNNRHRLMSTSDSDSNSNSNSKSSKNNDTNSSDVEGDPIKNDVTLHNSDDSKDSVVMNDDHNSNQLPSSQLDEIVPLITEDNETEFKSIQPTIKLVPMDRLLNKPSIAKENVVLNLDSSDDDDQPLSKCKRSRIDNSNSSQQSIAKIIENDKKTIIYSSSDDKRVRSLRKKTDAKSKHTKSKYFEVSSEESSESNEEHQSTDEEISIENAIQSDDNKSDDNKSDDVTMNDLTNSQKLKKIKNFCVRLTKLPMDLKPLLQKYNLSEICDSQRNVRVSRENGRCVEVYIT